MSKIEHNTADDWDICPHCSEGFDHSKGEVCRKCKGRGVLLKLKYSASEVYAIMASSEEPYVKDFPAFSDALQEHHAELIEMRDQAACSNGDKIAELIESYSTIYMVCGSAYLYYSRMVSMQYHLLDRHGIEIVQHARMIWATKGFQPVRFIWVDSVGKVRSIPLEPNIAVILHEFTDSKIAGEVLERVHEQADLYRMKYQL